MHFVTKKSFASVLQANPYLDKVHVLEDSLKDLCATLQKEKFDDVIDLHHNYRSFRIKRELRTKSYSFRKLNFEKWLYVNFRINRLPDLHIIDRYMETVAELGVQYDGEGMNYFLTSEDRLTLQSLPFKTYYALVLGARHATKRLTSEKLEALCNSLNLPIVLLGGPEDCAIGDELEKLVGEKVYNACGKFSLSASAALLEASQAVITHDTGLMHIAAALGKKIISVWGNTVPEFGMYPFYAEKDGGKNKGLKTVSEVKNLSCRPCSKIGYASCPKKHFDCMRKQDVSEIASRLEAE